MYTIILTRTSIMIPMIYAVISVFKPEINQLIMQFLILIKQFKIMQFHNVTFLAMHSILPEQQIEGLNRCKSVY